MVEFPKEVGTGDTVTVSSNDNRAYAPSDIKGEEENPIGGLVSMTVPVGEPEAVPTVPGFVPEFEPTGFPRCFAELAAQTVTCTGLRAEETYTLTDGAQKVSEESTEQGVVTAALAIKGGDAIALTNSSKLTLTTLHVAELKVNIDGERRHRGCERDVQSRRVLGRTAEGPVQQRGIRGALGNRRVGLRLRARSAR